MFELGSFSFPILLLLSFHSVYCVTITPNLYRGLTVLEKSEEKVSAEDKASLSLDKSASNPAGYVVKERTYESDEVLGPQTSPFSYANAMYYTGYQPTQDHPVIIQPSPSQYSRKSNYPIQVLTYGQPPKDNFQMIKYTSEKSTGPVYREEIVTRRTPPSKPQGGAEEKYGRSGGTAYYPQNDGRRKNSGYVSFEEPDRSSKFSREDFKSKEEVSNPEDKEEYKETRKEGGESSSYNRGVMYRKSYGKPPAKSINEKLGEREDYITDDDRKIIEEDEEPKKLLKSVPSMVKHHSEEDDDKLSHSKFSEKVTDKISETPLEEAGSSGKRYVSGGYVDDGLYEGGGYGYDAGKDYEKEKGKHYAEAHKASEGHKSLKEHEKKESFDKGEKQSHASKKHEGAISEKGGEKKGHVDTAKKFAQGHESAKSGKEKDFLHKKGHRKGHKKSGFHSVHHKDEFKKDETFFDESHDTGEEAAHGHSGHEQAHKHGSESKVGHHDSGFKEESHKKHGAEEGAKAQHEHKGHSSEKGHKSSHHEAKEHANKEGHKEDEKHGHSEKHEGHYL